MDPLTGRPIQMGWEFTTELNLSGQFRFIDDPDCQFGTGYVWTRTRTQSDGLEPLQTLHSEHITENMSESVTECISEVVSERLSKCVSVSMAERVLAHFRECHCWFVRVSMSESMSESVSEIVYQNFSVAEQVAWQECQPQYWLNVSRY